MIVMRRVHRHQARFRSSPTGAWRKNSDEIKYQDYVVKEPDDVVVPPFDPEPVPEVDGKDLWDMTLVQLKELAALRGISLKGARTKGQIIQALEE